MDWNASASHTRFQIIMANNYYEVLGVNKDATDEDIKKAFRDKAKLYHPDTTTDEAQKKELEEKFKELNTAYGVLSDPQERAYYDNPRPRPNPNINPGFNPFAHAGFGFNINDLFNQMNGQQFHFSSTRQINQEINVSLLDALLRNEIEIDTPIGKKVKFKLPPDLNNNTTFGIRINDEKNPNSTIIIHVKINVLIPNLSEEKMAKMKEIFSS